MWAFAAKPSDLDAVYWTHSLRDLKTIFHVKSQFHLALEYQKYEALISVISQALGSGDGKADKGIQVIESFDQLLSAFSKVGSAKIG